MSERPGRGADASAQEEWRGSGRLPLIVLRPRGYMLARPALLLAVIVALLAGASRALRQPPAVPGVTATVSPATVTPSATTGSPERFPINGYMVVNLARGAQRDAPLTVETGNADTGAHWVVSLRRWASGELVATVYLDASSVITLFVSAGEYQVVAAAGDVWQGDAALFGADTHALRFREAMRLTEPSAGVAGQALLLPASPSAIPAAEPIPSAAVSSRSAEPSQQVTPPRVQSTE